ncbi:MAG TPA: hypothetical protein VLG37_03570 [Candidatus Saccharimonadales bacterium]|nr:hypothetical protein [Candidatus Saccharimonadales bacterium]
MTSTASPPRSNLIEITNKLLDPFMLNDWVADEHGTLFDQRIDAYYGTDDALERIAKHIAGNFAALEYIKSVGAIDFIAAHNKDNKPFPWQVRITAVNRDRFFALLQNESLQFNGEKVVEQLPINQFPLPPVKQRVDNDFIIHTNRTISYRGKPIKLEGGQAIIAIALMSASITSSQWIGLEALQTLSGSVRINKIVSELRAIFQNATQKPEHKFFFNDRMLGYTFKTK